MARTDSLGHFLTDVADAIRTKGGTSATIQASNFDTAIANLPSGGGTTEVEEKDVNFYDYEGTIVHSYTKAEFLALESLPENPTHEGLVAQGWNWSLSEAKTYVNSYGKLDIGQMYITDDGKTRVYINLIDSNRLAPRFGVAVNGSALIEWGDDTTSTITGTSLNTTIYTQHIYSTIGKYIITISSEDEIAFYSSSSRTPILTLDGNTGGLDVYTSSIYKFEAGSNLKKISVNMFNSCSCLESVTFHNNISISPNDNLNCFADCYSLKYVTIPSSVTTMGSRLFSNSSLEIVSLPNNLSQNDGASEFYKNYNIKRICLTTKESTPASNYYQCYSLKEIIGEYYNATSSSFRECKSLATLKFSAETMYVLSTTFYNCNSIKIFDFTECTSVPSLGNTNAFTGISSDAKIVVPDSLYDSWIVANNWSTMANYIVKESEA